MSKGIEKNRVYTEGKGEKQPVADNKTADGRAKNRRVEIEVVEPLSRALAPESPALAGLFFVCAVDRASALRHVGAIPFACRRLMFARAKRQTRWRLGQCRV
ncbi:hypothetical protein GCM10027034_12190 [Ramlibacter solisilvae]